MKPPRGRGARFAECEYVLGISHSVEVACVVASVAMFVGTLIAVPIFFVKVSDDYFVRPRATRALPLRIARLVLGAALIVLGIAMVVLPGQGLLTLLVGLSVLDLPIKDRIVSRLLHTPQVRSGVDRLRRRAGRPPLIIPAAERIFAAT